MKLFIFSGLPGTGKSTLAEALGRHELQCSDVEQVKGYFVPWTEERLIMDRMDPWEENLARAIAYCE